MSDGSGTHRARLDGHIEIAVEQTIVADGLPGFAQGKNLGVRRGIVGAERAIASPAYDAPVANDDSSDGHLAQRKRALRLAQSFFHPEFVGVGHGGRVNSS